MISVDLHNMRQFIPLPYEAALTPRLRLAHDHLRAGTGAGGEFTGWVHLPEGYDREEFERIQAAAIAAKSNADAFFDLKDIFGTVADSELFRKRFATALKSLQQNGTRATLKLYLANQLTS